MPAPDDLYNHDVDFTTLALRYPQFAKRLKQNRQLDFSDPESVRQLTKSLLHRDFNLDIALPEDRLCPPVPNRFNYILFIQRLIDTTSSNFHDDYDPDRRVIGLDIGTGSSCIYPLLACRQRPNWFFLATEIDEKNRSYALKNISTNDLQSRIRLVDTDEEGKKLIPSDELERFERIDILMTNPPFYPSDASMTESAKQKSRPPNSSCTGAPIEMITPGGEVAFVSRLILESSSPQNKHRIQWFSSMLGKLSSVANVIEKLREKDCTNYAITEFIQGQKTRRWCVAWSWMGYRPSLAVARGVSGVSSGVEKKLLPVATEVEFETEGSGDTVAARVNEEINKLEVKWKFDNSRRIGMLLSQPGDVWSRKARRQREKLKHEHEKEDEEMKDQDDESADNSDEEAPEPGLVAKITLLSGSGGNSTSSKPSTGVHIRWLQGREAVVFESFGGWLRRKIEGRA